MQKVNPSGKADGTAKPIRKTAAEKRVDKVRKVVEDAEAKFKALGVQYCVIAIDRIEEDERGGNVFHTADITGDDFINVLHVGLKTKEDVIAMGVHLGRLMTIKERTLKDKLRPGNVARAIGRATNKRGYKG